MEVVIEYHEWGAAAMLDKTDDHDPLREPPMLSTDLQTLPKLLVPLVLHKENNHRFKRLSEKKCIEYACIHLKFMDLHSELYIYIHMDTHIFFFFFIPNATPT